MLARADAQLEGLSPSYFALVMATWIVSIGAGGTWLVGVVFPLGMQAVATFRMADVLDLEFLDAIPWVFLALALAAWLATLPGLARSLARGLR